MKMINKLLNKNLWIVTMVVALVLLSGCTQNESSTGDGGLLENKSDDNQVFCTMEAKICSDGTAVGRNSKNGCAFDPCPGEDGTDVKIDAKYRSYAANSVEQCAATTFICSDNETEAFFDQSGCGCQAIEPKKYITKDPEQCKVIRFMCTKNRVAFADSTGCGCEYQFETTDENIDNEDTAPEGKKVVHSCDGFQKGDNVACTMEYAPVCGWNDETIQCFAYPCATTYGNKCQACAQEHVASYTDGECPNPGDDVQY